MNKLAYGIEEAADVASVHASDITAAIQDGRLVARKVNAEPLLLRTEIQKWLESLPRF